MSSGGSLPSGGAGAVLLRRCASASADVSIFGASSLIADGNVAWACDHDPHDERSDKGAPAPICDEPGCSTAAGLLDTFSVSSSCKIPHGANVPGRTRVIPRSVSSNRIKCGLYIVTRVRAIPRHKGAGNISLLYRGGTAIYEHPYCHVGRLPSAHIPAAYVSPQI